MAVAVETDKNLVLYHFVSIYSWISIVNTE